MKLFILRHGKARDGSPDALRELSDRGREDLRIVIARRKAELASVRQIQSSTLVRAEQTAAIVSRELGFPDPVTENNHLAPWGKPMEFLKSVDESKGDLLIASHQPFVSDLVSFLTGEDIWMPTSSLVCVEAEYMLPGVAELCWQANPKD